jgi:hypothetical protein
MGKSTKEKAIKDAFDRIDKIKKGAEAANRDVTAAEYKTLNSILDEIEELQEQMDTEKRIGKLTEPINDGCGFMDTPFEERSGYSGSGPAKAKDFRSMFNIERNHALDRGGFKDTEEFLRAIWANRNAKVV